MRNIYLKTLGLLFLAPTPAISAIVPVDKFTVAPPGLSGTFGLALDGETGNRSEQEYAVDGILRYGWDTQSLVWITDYNYTKVDNEKNENDIFTHLRFVKNNYIGDNVDAEAFVQYGFDDFADLSSRKLLGGGARWRFEKIVGKATFWQQFGLGAFYEVEKSDSMDVKETSLRANIYANVRYQDSDKRPFELYTTAYLQPSLENISDIRVLIVSGVELPITDSLSFSIEVDMDYDSQPFEGVEKTNVEYGVRVSYAF